MELFRRFLGDESSGGDPEKAKKAARAGALGAALGVGALSSSASPADGAPRNIETAIADFERTDARFSAQDIAQIALNTFAEAADQPESGQFAVAQVTIASALSNRPDLSPDGTITGAVWRKNRFSWTRDRRADEPLPASPAFKNLCTTLGFALEGKTKAEALEALSRITGLPADTLFYKRADWNENDAHETRMSAATKEMFRSLTKVGEIGDHAFYADRRDSH